MKLNFLPTKLLAFFLFFGLIACGRNVPTLTSPPPTAKSLTAVEPTSTSPIATAEEPTAVSSAQPTEEPTLEPTATSASTPTVSSTEQAVATEPISYTITVDSPQPSQALAVAQAFTFSGTVIPVPSQRVELFLAANGNEVSGETMLAFADVNPETGSWSISEPLHPRHTGPATLHVRVAGTEVVVPVMLQLAQDEAATIVTVNQPLQGEIAVAGRTLLISGESRNLIDGKIQVGLFGCPADSDDNLLVQIEFEAGNGSWRAQIILPETAAADCDVARLRVTTGGLASDNPQIAWASDQFLTLVAPTDERADIFTAWEPMQLTFTPGQTTAVVGTAVNPVDDEIQVQLIQNDVVLVAETAVPDPFGYWETALILPAEAEPSDLLLRVSTGAGDSYRELSLPATVSQ